MAAAHPKPQLPAGLRMAASEKRGQILGWRVRVDRRLSAFLARLLRSGHSAFGQTTSRRIAGSRRTGHSALRPSRSFKAFFFDAESGHQLHPAGAAQLTKQYRYRWELQSKLDLAIGVIATGTGAASAPRVAMWFGHRRSAEAG
jgi:hypothetical protein